LRELYQTDLLDGCPYEVDHGESETHFSPELLGKSRGICCVFAALHAPTEPTIPVFDDMSHYKTLLVKNYLVGFLVVFVKIVDKLKLVENGLVFLAHFVEAFFEFDHEVNIT